MALHEVEPVAGKREAKILIFDIERLPGQFSADFWSLGDFKNRRINPDDVTEWPRTICLAWKWLGDKRVNFASEWDDGQLRMHEAIWQAIDEADIVTGHNAKGFDLKHLRTFWRINRMGNPSTARVIDTLTVARSQYGDESKKLDILNQRDGISAKTDKYRVEMARNAVNGVKADQRKIRGYNIGDIIASEERYLSDLPFIPNHPHVAPVAAQDGPAICPRCASTSVERAGTYSPGVYVYLAWRCHACKGNFRTQYQGRGPSVRSL